MTYYLYYFVPCYLGVLSHLVYFRHGEHHLYSLLYLNIALLSPCVVLVALRVFGAYGPETLGHVLRLQLLYVSSIWISMLFYRSSRFHRLSQFPGPLLWRLTKFTQSLTNLNSVGMKNLDRLHREYGEYVRTGPSEISITDPDSLSKIHGAASSCIRAPWSDMAAPLKSVFETRVKSLHDKRRRVWDRALSTKCLADYQVRIATHVNELVSEIYKRDGAPWDASEWFKYFSLDVVGDVAFSESFGMLSGGRNREAVSILEECQHGLPIMGPLPWMFPILTSLPLVSKPFYRMVGWCYERTKQRQKRDVLSSDIMGALLSDDSSGKDRDDWLAGDSRIVIAAGSAAVASTLSFGLYHLIRDKGHIDTIRAEILREEESKSSTTSYLDAFINEILRLYPPNPSGFLRTTPKAGIHIGNRYIPGDTTICTPLWSLHRSERNFVEPLKFQPERWTTKSEMVIHKEAFIPFGCGPYGCIGKKLALMEIRTALIELVKTFDFAFAELQSGESFLERTRDTFTLLAGELPVVATKAVLDAKL
ncbi:cytochrome P450 [Byssothecium circinans]|uniref:Cytochrome P450 n=1 Tax=Byssothecium circinans TaxID=147558 RepID=A0A6A5TMA8_9PLEO|nr:cytochrome P450 [Byssothecium circinans]